MVFALVPDKRVPVINYTLSAHEEDHMSDIIKRFGEQICYDKITKTLFLQTFGHAAFIK